MTLKERMAAAHLEELRTINQNAIKHAEQLAKGWAPGSWEETNLTHKKGGRC